MGIFGNTAQISAQLYDVGTGRVVGKVSLNQDAIPETWETVPTFEHEGTWQLLGAAPMLGADCIRRKSVELLVRRPFVDSDDAVYPGPTIAGKLAPILPGSTKSGAELLLLLPEDWRQVELVSASNREQLEAHRTAINDIIQNCSIEQGFTKRHVRADFDTPMSFETRFSFDQFLSLFPDGVEKQVQLGYYGVGGLVNGGFSFVSPFLTQFYGVVSDGVVATLGITAIGSHEFDCPEVQDLADFALEKGLILADWSQGKLRAPDTDEFFQFFDMNTASFDETAPI